MAKTLKYICALISLLVLCTPATAQEQPEEIIKKMTEKKAKLINGFGVGVDGVGLIMKAAGGRFANMEVIGRLNLLEKYFPICELGIGDCTREGSEMLTKFHTRAPYYRIGMDYNLNKKLNGNRMLLGLRYGFSSFGYDYSNPNFVDNVYGSQGSLSFTGLNGNMHWLEFCIGVETRLWSIVRLGFNVRYKGRIYSKFSEHGEPWFVPGYGKNGGTTWGGSVNLMFDI